MSAIPNKIQSILNQGILAGGGDLSVVRSYDSGRLDKVSLNCISRIEGIDVSLMHEAKGGFIVAIEEKIGGEGGS